jgi:hypothetical protein
MDRLVLSVDSTMATAALDVSKDSMKDNAALVNNGGGAASASSAALASLLSRVFDQCTCSRVAAELWRRIKLEFVVEVRHCMV